MFLKLPKFLHAAGGAVSAALIFLVSAALYSPSLLTGLFLDDAVNYENARLAPMTFDGLAGSFELGIKFVQDGIRPACLDAPAKFFRPLTVLSFKADDALFSNNFNLYHIQNIIYASAVNACALPLARFYLKSRTAAVIAVFFTALCPVNFFTVFWLSSRTDLLCAALFAISLLLFIRAAELIAEARGRAPGEERTERGGGENNMKRRGDGKKNLTRPGTAFYILYAGSLAFYALSLAAKEQSLIMPAVVFATAAMFLSEGGTRRDEGEGVLFKKTGAAAAILSFPYILLTAAHFIVRSAHLGGLALPTLDFYMFDLSKPLLAAVLIFQKTVFGILSLAVFTPPVPVKILYYKPEYVIFFGLSLAPFLYLLKKFALAAPFRNKRYRAAVAAFFLALVPTLPMLPAPHYHYMPSIFFSMLLAGLFVETDESAIKPFFRVYSSIYAAAGVASAAIVTAFLMTVGGYTHKLCSTYEAIYDKYMAGEYFKNTGRPPEFYLFDLEFPGAVAAAEFRLRKGLPRPAFKNYIISVAGPLLGKSAVEYGFDEIIVRSDFPMFSGIWEEFAAAAPVNFKEGAVSGCEKYDMNIVRTARNPVTGNTGVTEFTIRFKDGRPVKSPERYFIGGNYRGVGYGN